MGIFYFCNENMRFSVENNRNGTRRAAHKQQKHIKTRTIMKIRHLFLAAAATAALTSALQEAGASGRTAENAEAAPAAGKDKKPKAAEHTALFDDFTYSGHDACYDESAMSDESAFFNPLLPGWHSDPSVCRAGDDYFLVTSTFSYYPGVPIFHSRDLLNWRQIGHVLSRPSQLRLDGQDLNGGGIYAPAIAYNPRNKTFYMITTNVGEGNFFVKTKDPFGSWSDPIMLPDVNGIDPSFLFDDDGRAYIVHNDAPDGTPEYDGHRAIRIHEFDVEREQTVGQSKVIVDKGVNPAEKPIWIEGPHLYKINGKYYLMAAEGGTGDRHSEVIFRADSPFGPYSPAPQNPILTQRDLDSNRPLPITCTGHADLVQTPRGDWWAVFLGCRPFKEQFENLGRETFMLPISWNSGGWPVITEKGEKVRTVVSVPGAKRGGKPTFGNFTLTDSFSAPTLGLEWMTLRGPATGLYSLTSHPGSLALRCADASAAEKAVPAYIGRRIQHSEFDCTVTMTFSPADGSKEAAGLLLLKNETRQYFLCVANTPMGRAVELRKTTDGGVETLVSKPIPPKQTTLRLRIESTGLTFNFSFSTKKGRWTEVAGGIDAGYLSTRHAGGFTGTTIGMYATSK